MTDRMRRRTDPLTVAARWRAVPLPDRLLWVLIAVIVALAAGVAVFTLASP